MNKISEVTKRDIKDLFVCGVTLPFEEDVKYIPWHGRLEDVDFLSRLYKLDELPSFDSRFRTASMDIATHVSFGDWDEDWVFSDSRFDLEDGTDEQYLDFICEVFHPAVTRKSVVTEGSTEAEYFKQISELLKAEGYELYETKKLGGKPVIGWREYASSGKIIEVQAAALKQVFSSTYLQQQIDQMQDSIESNPADAIGKAKELIESCCKTILEEKRIVVDKNWEVPRLVKEACTALNLIPNTVNDSIQGADTIKRIMGQLAAIPHGLAELRNPYGSGHGKSDSFVGLAPKHARLAVGASSTVCWFIWETYEEDKKGRKDFLF